MRWHLARVPTALGPDSQLQEPRGTACARACAQGAWKAGGAHRGGPERCSRTSRLPCGPEPDPRVQKQSMLYVHVYACACTPARAAGIRICTSQIGQARVGVPRGRWPSG